MSSGVKLGENCNLGQNVMIAADVRIGNNVKIQNNVSVYSGTTIEDDVFLGPSCVLTNISNPRSQVVRRSLYEPTVIRRALEFGASGFIPKSLDVDQIGAAIQAVLAGDTWIPPDIDLSGSEDAESADLIRRLATLTPQQVRVLMMLSEGLLNKQIAYELGVSEATVKAHVSAILDKLGVDSRTQAVIVAGRIGATQRSPTGID